VHPLSFSVGLFVLGLHSGSHLLFGGRSVTPADCDGKVVHLCARLCDKNEISDWAVRGIDRGDLVPSERFEFVEAREPTVRIPLGEIQMSVSRARSAVRNVLMPGM
jgi:hypothetical protein